MEDLLIETDFDLALPPSVVECFSQLRQEIAELRIEVAALRRENLELRQQAGYWKSRHADALVRIAELEKEVEHLRGENRKLQDQAFGRKSEKQSRSDRSNELDDPNETKPPQPRGHQRGHPGHQLRDYSHLPVRTDPPRELPEAERVCPDCGSPLVACGTEEAEQLEIETLIYRRVTPRCRSKRTCQCSGQRTWTAPPVPKLIPKGLLGVSVWVDILLDQFDSHRPTERLLN
jgi:transposase